MMATAEIHSATLTPSKLELLATWLPRQDWFTGASATDLERVAAARFVDPAGEVGIEIIIVGAGDRTFHVPLTYRGQPLANGEEFLVGEMYHSVLGDRWVYDATGDPVYQAEVRRVIAEGDHEAELSQGTKSMTVLGSGQSDTATSLDEASLVVVRDLGARPDQSTDADAIGSLTGRWERNGAAREAVLVLLRS